MQMMMIQSGEQESSIFHESNAEFCGNAFSPAEEEEASAAVAMEDFFDLDDDDIAREEALESFYDMKYGIVNDEMATEEAMEGLSELGDIAVMEAIGGFSDVSENILRYDILREEAQEGFSVVGENILREKGKEGLSVENILGEKVKEGTSGENVLGEKLKEGEFFLGEIVKEGENILREKVKEGETILREKTKEGENILREKVSKGFSGENIFGEKVKEGFSDVGENILRETAVEGFSDVADDDILRKTDENIVRAEADAEDSSNSNLSSSPKSALELGFSKCVWLVCQISSAAIPLLLAITLIRRLMAWKMGWWYGCRRGTGISCSTWELALWLGFDAGFISVVVVMASLVPFMIMTWTTALVFRVAFERHRLRGAETVVCEGKRIAREIYFSTFHDVLRGGKILAALTAIVCLVILNLFRGIG